MRRFFRFATVILAVATFSATASAQAHSTVKCTGNKYWAIDRSAFPSIQGARTAIDLPKLTDGYAPRCLVADSVAGAMQTYWTRHQKVPGKIQIRGARWDAGTWTYKVGAMSKHEPFTSPVTARHGSEVVRFRIGS